MSCTYLARAMCTLGRLLSQHFDNLAQVYHFTELLLIAKKNISEDVPYVKCYHLRQVHFAPLSAGEHNSTAPVWWQVAEQAGTLCHQRFELCTGQNEQGCKLRACPLNVQYATRRALYILS